MVSTCAALCCTLCRVTPYVQTLLEGCNTYLALTAHVEAASVFVMVYTGYDEYGGVLAMD